MQKIIKDFEHPTVRANPFIMPLIDVKIRLNRADTEKSEDKLAYRCKLILAKILGNLLFQLFNKIVADSLE